MLAVTPHVSAGTRARSLLGGGVEPKGAHQQLLSPSQILCVSTLHLTTSPATRCKSLIKVSEAHSTFIPTPGSPRTTPPRALSRVPLPLGLCEKNIPEQFQSYYSPFITATTVICITRCDKRSTNPYPCVHGTCTVTHSGPQCE